MGRLAEKIKPLLPTHPHPLVPGAATAQLLAGPLLSVADHLRDFLGKLEDRVPGGRVVRSGGRPAGTGS